MRVSAVLAGGLVLGLCAGEVSAQHLGVVDVLGRRVMLLDASDGRVVNANYITQAVGPIGLATEALQVEQEIWISDSGNAVRRYSLDGKTFIGSIVGPFNPPMNTPQGMAYDGTTVFVACSQVQQHGLFASWVTKLNPDGSPAGLFTVPDDRHRYDIALDGSNLLVTDVDDQALDLHSTSSFALLARIDSFPQTFGHNPTQVARLSTGEIALGTTKGLRIYDSAGVLVGQHYADVHIKGVGELGTGELVLGIDSRLVAYDLATGIERTLASGVNTRFVSEITGATVCVADANADGSLTPADFSAWVSAFNTQGPQCDQNDDGVCSPADFSAWVANFNAGC